MKSLVRLSILLTLTLALVAMGCSSDDGGAEGAAVSSDATTATDASATDSAEAGDEPVDEPDSSDTDGTVVDEQPTTSDGEVAAANEGGVPVDEGGVPVDEVDGPVELKLLTHDSFALSDDTLAAFTERTGHQVEVVRGGDAGELVNRSVLTAGNPEADVLFGVDNTFLSAALDADVFLPGVSTVLDDVGDVVPAELQLDEQRRVVPVDFGDVCLNYDRAWFVENGLAPPASLDDLIDPAYSGLTVVEDPSTSSPGLSFLLATIDRYGEDGFTDWWASLLDNDVAVAAGWEEAYYGQFTWGSEGGGNRPIVVSYASSPPAEVLFGDFETPPEQSPTAVVTDGCYRQIEFAGVLAGTKHPTAAGLLVDFMLSETFQSDIALNMFVFPARSDIALPEEFTTYTDIPAEPASLAPADIEAGRSDWIDAWDEAMAG